MTTADFLAAYSKGVRAFQEQLPPGSNPYSGKKQRALWHAWLAGYHGEMDKSEKG